MVPDIDRDPVTSHSTQVPSDRDRLHPERIYFSSFSQPTPFASHPIFLFFLQETRLFFKILQHQSQPPTMKGSLVEFFSAMLVAGCFAVLMSDEGKVCFSLSTALVFMFHARCGVRGREGELITHGGR